jgi:hypothetical protein
MLSPLDLSSLDSFSKSFVDLKDIPRLASEFDLTSYPIIPQPQMGAN